MVVPVDGQLLLLNQPMDGPVPEPIVLGPAQKLDILLDAPDPVRLVLLPSAVMPAISAASNLPMCFIVGNVSCMPPARVKVGHHTMWSAIVSGQCMSFSLFIIDFVP